MDLMQLNGGLGPKLPERVNRSLRTESGETSGIGETSESGFGEMLRTALTEVQGLQNQADGAIDKLATGEAQDVHQVMVAFEQARLSMQTLVEVRNKLVEAYQEVLRIQV